MAQLTIANSNTQHYVKMFCTTTTKSPSTSKFYVHFKKKIFQRSKKYNTPFYLQMFCALSGRSLSWNTPVFSRFTSREHANFIGCHFFHPHVLPHHSKAQLLRHCGKRSFGVAKSWKATLIRVPWFGLHVENLGDVIIYIQFWLWPGLLDNQHHIFVAFNLDLSISVYFSYIRYFSLFWCLKLEGDFSIGCIDHLTGRWSFFSSCKLWLSAFMLFLGHNLSEECTV